MAHEIRLPALGQTSDEMHIVSWHKQVGDRVEVAEPLLLVETDAPYLTPVPFRGKPNASYLMPHTVRFMAEQRGVEEAALCDLLFANAQRAFGAW